jgi:SH3 domain-containing protein/NlpC/P60 family protein
LRNVRGRKEQALAHVGGRLRALIIAILVAVLVAGAQPPPRVAASGAADAVIRYAMQHLGAPWRYGAEGPYAFDCTGLVIYAFRRAGYYDRIGSGAIRSARQFYYWFRSRGLSTRSGGVRGDLVVYGGGTHVGIYLGGGKVVSTLTRGVSVHGLHAVTASFTAFLRTRLPGTTSSGPTDAPDSQPDVMSGARSGGDHTARSRQAPGSDAAGSASTATRYVTAYRLNFRTGPGTQYSIVDVLSKGTRLAVLGSARDRSNRTWYRVRIASGRTGWVAGWYTRT